LGLLGFFLSNINNNFDDDDEDESVLRIYLRKEKKNRLVKVEATKSNALLLKNLFFFHDGINIIISQTSC
jgi:hypothetical protein